MKKVRDESIIRRPVAFAGRITIGIGLFFFALYALLHGQCAYPVASAGEIVDCAGLGIVNNIYPPLMQLLGRLLAELPLGLELTTRFHLLSAALVAFIAGASAGMVQYWCTVFLGEDPERKNPSIGGFIAAMAFAMALLASRPIWLAATRFYSMTLAVALVVGALLAFTGFVIVDRKRLLLIAGGLLGLAAVESAEAAALVPCFAAWAVVRENRWGSKYPTSVRFVLLFSSIFVGVLIGLMAIAGCQAWFGTGLGATPLISALSGLVFHHGQELFSVVTLHSCMPYLVLGALTAALAIPLARQIMRGETSKSCILLLPLVLVGVIYATFGGQWTFWRYASAAGRMPLYSALTVATAFAFLIIACYAMLSAGDRADGEEDEDEYDHEYAARRSRRFGFILLPCGALAMAALVGWNLRQGWNVHEGESVRVAADDVLEKAQTRTWAVTEGLLDPLLTLRARERNQPLLLLSSRHAGSAAYRQQIAAQLLPSFELHLQLRLKTLLDQDFNSFLTELFQHDPQIADHAICLGSTSWLWQRAGQEMRSAAFCTVGANTTLPAPNAGSERRIIEALERDARIFELRGLVAQLRQRLSLSLNNRGVECELAGDLAGARQCYERARQIRPGNCSALINLLGLSARQPTEAEPLLALTKEFHRLLARNHQPHIRSWLERDGLILDPRIEAAAEDAPPAQDAARHQKLLDRVQNEMLDRFRQSDLENARRILEAATHYGMKEDELLPEWIYYYIAKGDDTRAGDLLLLGKEISDLPPDLQGLLGYRYVRKGELQYVASYLIPQLAGSLHGRDQFYIYLLRALLGLAKNSAIGNKEAQASYRMAAKCHPEARQALLPAILRCDLKADDLRSAEISALNLLQSAPGDPFANLAMGLIREASSQSADARRYYQAAAAAGDAAAIKRLEELKSSAR